MYPTHRIRRLDKKKKRKEFAIFLARGPRVLTAFLPRLRSPTLRKASELRVIGRATGPPGHWNEGDPDLRDLRFNLHRHPPQIGSAFSEFSVLKPKSISIAWWATPDPLGADTTTLQQPILHYRLCSRRLIEASSTFASTGRPSVVFSYP